MPTTIRFDFNVPVEVALQNNAGITVAGRYSDRVMYALVDDRRMYVAPYVAQRIAELGIRPGELIQICKRHVITGRRKTVNWLIERVDPDGDTQLARDLRDSIEMVNARHQNGPAQVALPGVGEATRTTSSTPTTDDSVLAGGASKNGNSVQNGARSQPETVGTVTNQLPPDTQLARALKTAIAAAVEAEKFAKALDYNIRFSTDDVRSMGITLLIGMQQRQR
jgi:hypothetical protein